MTIVHLGTTALLLDRHLVRRGDQEIRLTPLEVRLLRYLVARPGRAVARDELLDGVWGYSRQARTRAVDHAVARLRKKIEDDPGAPRWLRLCWGEGYCLEWRDGAAEARPCAELLREAADLLATGAVDAAREVAWRACRTLDGLARP
ncbi:MAG: winged helix-turn-helix domain-containing protein [Myxococcota bacterium]